LRTLGVMKCSNAASVSSPGGGRGWFWRSPRGIGWHSRAIENLNPVNGIAGKAPSRVALDGADLPWFVMEPNARDPNNQGSLRKPKWWDQRNPVE
jgi:hypothetical protein